MKAIIWVESGGPTNPAWKTRPMQIGNPGDAGWGVLKRGEEASNIVMDEQLKANILHINTPRVNIKAGTAYLINRLAESNVESLRSDTDKTQYEYTVVPGDSLSKVARKVGTTVEEIKKSNPTKIAMIRAGDKLEYHKAKMERVITGWRAVTAQTIARRYNWGDTHYQSKLNYVLKELFPEKTERKTK